MQCGASPVCTHTHTHGKHRRIHKQRSDVPPGNTHTHTLLECPLCDLWTPDPLPPPPTPQSLLSCRQPHLQTSISGKRGGGLRGSQGHPSRAPPSVCQREPLLPPVPSFTRRCSTVTQSAGG